MKRFSSFLLFFFLVRLSALYSVERTAAEYELFYSILLADDETREKP